MQRGAIATLFGYGGQILIVDLSERTARAEPLPEAVARALLGGVGLGAWLLYRYAPPGVDPLGPENPLIFAGSPLVGTGVTTTSKYALVTKSPLTGCLNDSLSSSHLALSLKASGWDAVVIRGAASEPTALVIAGESIQFLPAGAWWGLGTGDAEAAIEAALGPGAHAAVIGPAGEACVRYATVTNDGRHAGRGGSGAVMGSKRLKAVVFQARPGQNPCSVADPVALRAAAEGLRQRSLGPETAKYRVLGTVANLLAFDRLGALPAHNFAASTFAGAERLSGERLRETRSAGRSACAACTIGCEHHYRLREADGPMPGGEVGRSSGSGPSVTGRLEYETLFALGPLIGVADPEAVLEAAALCDRLGLDTLSAGGTLAWAMESASRGLLPESVGAGPCAGPGGHGGPPLLRWGDAAGVMEALRRIARREGVGDLLAEGSRAAAAQVGRGSEAWAMQVKGLELPGYEPRSLKTMALGLATGHRGACHNRSGAYEADLSGKVDRLTADDGRGRLAAESEEFSAVLDSLVLCKFVRRCFDDFYEEAAALVRHVTGWEFTAEELRRVGERITNLRKAFNLREGWGPADDTLPPRLLAEPLPDGPAAGVRLTEEELRSMIDGYYAARGWTPDGRISEEKWRELGLGSLIGEFRHERE